MNQFLTISFVTLSLSGAAIAQSCGSATGVNLSQGNGPYSGFHSRSQGAVGTCYAHSASDLISTFIGGNDRLNIYDAAIVSDNAADGGQPSDVMENIIKRGWACKDYGQYANFFPSQTKNIITELMDAVAGSGMPVFYTANYQNIEGAARQQRIAVLAGKMAAKENKPCGAYLDAHKGLDEFLKLQNNIQEIDSKLKTLKDELDPFDGWFGTRETATINKDIANLIKKKNDTKVKSDKAHLRYSKGNNILQAGQNFMVLDGYSEQQAAESVYYWAEKTYPAVKQAFENYGAAEWAPTMQQYIVGKVQRDPATGYWAAGGLYPYRLMERLMNNACKDENRIAVSKTLKTKTMTPASGSYQGMTTRLESLLQKSSPQGVGITINSAILQGSSGSAHAVNIIGCRTVNGTKEYLIHNSWGSDCNSYHTRYRAADKCQGGKVWIPATTVMSSAQEIQWLEK
jgi:hypothetical protein